MLLSCIDKLHKINLKNINRFINDKEISFGKTKLLSRPVNLDIVPTTLCNLKCIFCIQYSSKTQHLSIDNFKIIANKLFPYATQVFFCSGGEPFLNKSFMKFLDICQKYKMPFNITTNGTLLSEKICHHLVKNIYLNNFNFSFDGIKRKTLESIRRGVNYQKVVNSIKLMIALKNKYKRKNLAINIRCAIMKRNIKELPDLILQAQKWGVDKIIVNYLNVVNTIDRDESLFYHPQRLRRILKRVSRIAKAKKIRVDLPKIPTEKNEGKLCTYPWRFIKIDPDGAVRFCYKSWDNPIGNILKTNNFFNLWNNKHYQLLRKTVNSKKPYFKYCSICDIRKGLGQRSSHIKYFQEDLYEFDKKYGDLYGIKIPRRLVFFAKREKNKRGFVVNYKKLKIR